VYFQVFISVYIGTIYLYNMPLFETLCHTYKHAWNQISLASWRKYPSPERPDVLSVDILSREVNAQTGVLTTRRLMTCKGTGPAWIQKLLGNNYLFFVEDATIDPINKKMVLSSRNVSFSDLIQLEETCTYTTHPENRDWTHFSQDAKITAFPFGIKGKIEKFCLDKFVSNATKGREIMEQAISRVKMEQQKLEELAEEGLATLERAAREALPTPHTITSVLS